MCALTYSCVPWLTHVCHGAFICVTLLTTHQCAVTHSCVPWITHMKMLTTESHTCVGVPTSEVNHTLVCMRHITHARVANTYTCVTCITHTCVRVTSHMQEWYIHTHTHTHLRAHTHTHTRIPPNHGESPVRMSHVTHMAQIYMSPVHYMNIMPFVRMLGFFERYWECSENIKKNWELWNIFKTI